MKLLITLTILLFVTSGIMAQMPNQKIYLTNKGLEEYEFNQKTNIITELLKLYEFVYNEKDKVYESSYLSWIYQFYIIIDGDVLIVDCYGTPNVKYFDDRNVYKVFEAFNKLIRWSVANNMVQPTTPEELWGWKHNRTTTTEITIIKGIKYL